MRAERAAAQKKEMIKEKLWHNSTYIDFSMRLALRAWSTATVSLKNHYFPAGKTYYLSSHNSGSMSEGCPHFKNTRCMIDPKYHKPPQSEIEIYCSNLNYGSCPVYEKYTGMECGACG